MHAAAVHRRASDLLFTVIVVGVYASALAIVGQLTHLERSSAVAVGLTMDMVVVVPLAFYLLVVRAHGPRQSGPQLKETLDAVANDMSIQLIEAAQSDVGVLRPMLDRYLHELCGHREVPVGATDSTSYPYLDAYWSEPGRHAFLIRSASRAVGFALIRDPGSTGSATHQLAEFFIEPESRRLGIGRRAAAAIWQRFPGQWELQVHARNAAAVRFWSSSAEAATGKVPQMHEVQAPDGRRVQFSFHVEHAV